jgi:hypothetical protein
MGEATSKSGQSIRMICEAVVQRTPEYLDSRDPPHTAPSNLKPRGINAEFGRRFEIISFRWLSAREL